MNPIKQLQEMNEVLNDTIKVLENRVVRMGETIRRAEISIDALVQENCNLRESLGSDDGLINDPIINMDAQFKTIRETTNE